MIKTDHEFEYCMTCGDATDQQQTECRCGSRNFIFGDKFTYENKKLKCSCGSTNYRMTFHLNRSPIFNSTHKCTECNATVGMQTYYEMHS